MIDQSLDGRSHFTFLHMFALLIMAVGVLFVTYSYKKQEKLGAGTPRVMQEYVITKMYNIIEQRNALMIREGSMLKLRDDEVLGGFLVDQNGKTLYGFKDDDLGKSTCYGECADRWPYLWTTGQIAFGEGVNGELGIVERADGPGQVTYDNVPIYYFSGDQEAGDVNGQGLNDKWFVIEP